MSTTRRPFTAAKAQPTEDSDQCSSTSDNNSVLPKHIPFPDIENQSEVFYESFSFAVALCALGCQYLELYRTVWWLPEFANKQALHFQLIDKILLAFIVAVLSRKLMALLVLTSAKFLRKRHKSYHTLANCIPHIYGFQLICLLGICCFDIFLKYGFLSLSCLCYP